MNYYNEIKRELIQKREIGKINEELKIKNHELQMKNGKLMAEYGYLLTEYKKRTSN